MNMNEDWVGDWKDPIRPSKPFSVRRRQLWRIAGWSVAIAVLAVSAGFTAMSLVNWMAQ